MNESAARAERFELTASSDRWYIWQVPQKPVSAKIVFAVIDRLEREAVESFRSLSSNGSEIGGILLGRSIPGTPHLVTVEEYLAVPCDYSRGPLYRLSDADLARFRSVLQKQSGGDGLAPIGFFRSHTRKGLSLDADDVTVLDGLFPAAHQIALVIRPTATKASVAGIFIRENGVLQTESSCQEFPFRTSLLEGASPEPPPVKVPPRAQIVPIASRREIALENFVPPAPVKETVPPEEPKVEAREKLPIAAPEIPAAPVKEVTPKKEEAKPAAPPKPAAAAPAPAAPAPAPAAPAPAVPAPAAVPPQTVAAAPAPPVIAAPPAPMGSDPFSLSEPVPAKSNKMMFLGLGALVPLLALVLLFVYPGWLRQRPAPAKPAPDSSPLALRVERTGNEILLTWKTDSDNIRTAAQAVLQISDGPQQENITLDAGQFRSGRIVYSPGTSDVVFRMEVSGQGGAKIASESLRVLGSRPSAFDAAAGAAAKTAAPGQPIADPAAETPAEEIAPVKKTPQVLKPFSTESLSQRLRPAGPADLPDAPLVTKVEASSQSISLNLGVTAPPPPAAAPPPATQANAPEPAAPRTAAKVVQAEVVRRIAPEYPKMARDSGVRGVVEIKARVGIDGKVKAIESVTGPSMLQRPAVDAVKQWLYKPTILNGAPVESDTVITLRFGTN